MKKLLLTSELLIFFIFLPLVYYFDWVPGPKSLLLLLGFAYCMTLLLLDKSFDRKKLGFNRFRSFGFIVKRFAVTAILITAYILIFEPENLLIIPRENPWLWLAIMVFYPIWSATPQELIFRVFYFHRYSQLIRNKNILILVNAILFAYIHIIFNNWIAIVGGFIIGVFWAHTYLRSQSLLTVSTEHAVYGNFVYTIGLGHYFYVPDF